MSSEKPSHPSRKGRRAALQARREQGKVSNQGKKKLPRLRRSH